MKTTLGILYFSQLNNENNPSGSCNVTSIAMCLDFLKVQRKQNSGQFEDELYKYAIAKGYNRHSPHDLAQIVRDYGATDTFKHDATLAEVKQWLDAGKPAVIHGYFTSFGHIIVLIGYDKTGFFVHDPYGEYYADGYDKNVHGGKSEHARKGENLHYSYKLIQRTCMHDGDFWVHFIGKKQ